MTRRIRERAMPIVAVDTVEMTSDRTVTARKRVVASDPYLEGHYPHFTIYPGIFIIESVTQAVDAYVLQAFGPAARAELTQIDTVRFTSPLVPGDELRLTCDICTGAEALVVTATADDGREHDAGRVRRVASARLQFALLATPVAVRETVLVGVASDA